MNVIYEIYIIFFKEEKKTQFQRNASAAAAGVKRVNILYEGRAGQTHIIH